MCLRIIAETSSKPPERQKAVMNKEFNVLDRPSYVLRLVLHELLNKGWCIAKPQPQNSSLMSTKNIQVIRQLCHDVAGHAQRETGY
jgi:hypothetical protein